jgi:hypothetical protein
MSIHVPSSVVNVNLRVSARGVLISAAMSFFGVSVDFFLAAKAGDRNRTKQNRIAIFFMIGSSRCNAGEPPALQTGQKYQARVRKSKKLI